jgi:hypothetical protein
MLYIVLLIFFVVKTFFNEFDFILSAILIIVSLYSLNKQTKNSFNYYFLLLLTNGGYLILLSSCLLMVGYILNKRHSPKFVFIELYFFVFCFLLFLFFFVGDRGLHDYLRYLLLIMSPAFFLFNFRRILLTNKVKLNVLPIFVICVLSNLIYTILLGNERNSIFNGSENIALIIFTFMYMLLLGQKYSTKVTILSSCFFMLFLFSLSSRSTLIIIAILGAVYLLSLKLKLKNIFFVVFSIISLFFVYGNFFDSIQSNAKAIRVFSIIDSARTIDPASVLDLDFSELNHVDVRARLWSEALFLTYEKPLIGHGVVNPMVFSDKSNSGMSTFHSSIFDILVTYGTIGLLLVFGFLFLFYRSVSKMLVGNKYLVRSVFYSFVILSFIQPFLLNIQVLTLLFFTLLVFCKGQYDSEANLNYKKWE